MTLVICCPVVCSVKQSWPWVHASTCYIQSVPAPAPWLDLCCYSAMMTTSTGHVLTCSSWACTLIKSLQDHDDVGILHMHYELVDNILLHAHIHTHTHTYIGTVKFAACFSCILVLLRLALNYSLVSFHVHNLLGLSNYHHLTGSYGSW